MFRCTWNQLMSSLVVATAAALPSAPVMAFQSGASPGGGDGGVLAGPKVEQDAEKQPAPMMGPGGQERRRAQDVPPQQWFSALRGLGLTEDQQTKVRAIMDEFQRALKDYEASGGERIQDLRRQAREARQSGTPPPPELREKLQKFENDRPKATPYQSRIWNELTDEQQDKMKARLDEIRADMTQRREDRKADGKPADEPMMDEMNREGPPPQRPQARRGNAGNGSGGGLDDAGKRRLDFLLAHQSAQAAGRHPQGAPTASERQFRFDDQDR